MQAARYYGTGDIRVEAVDPRSPGPGEVRIAVEACGICGSDLHKYVAGPGSMPSEAPHPVTGETLPLVMGHELGGTVAEVGDGVDVPVGTAVAVNPIIWCGTCRYCLAGEYHRCADRGFVGLHGRGGGFAEELVVRAEQVVPVPEAVPTELAALVEPYTVGLHAVRRSALSAGDSVAVFGTGPIGLTVVQAARAAGAGDIYVSEPRDARRERAGTAGADVTIDPAETDPVERIRDGTAGGADVVFEVAGIAPTVNAALESAKSGGNVTIVSLFEEAIQVQPNEVVSRELTVTGTAAFQGGPRSAEEFSRTLRYFSTGAFDPESLVTARIDLADIVESGFERLVDPESEQVKILVRP